MKTEKQFTILIIDDEEIIRQSYSFYLEDIGYETLQAENGIEGIEIFKSKNPDLVMVDLRMPGMGGLEVLEIINSINPNVPTIVVSGTRAISDAIEALHNGAWDYLLKPIEDMTILRHSVDNALEKAGLRRENREYQERLEQMVTDRTGELEKAVSNLNSSKIQLERILDDIQTGIVIIEKSSKEIMYINPSAADMFGAPSDDILGLKCWKVLCPSEEGNCPILDLDMTKDASERVLRRVDGTEIPILKTGTHTPYNGKECLLESFVDLTQQKKIARENENLEKQLRQAQKLESIGTLAGGVAHDFNNLLAGIMGASEILKEVLSDNSEANEYLDMILETSEKAADLTSKLLTFSRRSDIQINPVNCHDTIKDSITILEHTLDKRISIIPRLNAQNHIIMADGTTLQNSFINLGVNAGHAMPGGGEILIESGNIEITGESEEYTKHKIEKGNYIRINFKDNGCGMSEDVMERIFEPFFTTKELGKGTGLGLSAVYGVITGIHGHILVKSRINAGTVFSIYIPIIV